MGPPAEHAGGPPVAGSEERARLEQHRRLGYRPQLDGIRAVAILPVIGFHAYRAPRAGFLGVDIFFVLSGFLITTLLVQEWQMSGRISLRHFYLRRALRLLPALLVAVAGYLVYTAAVSMLGKTHSWLPLRQALVGSGYGVLYIMNIMLAIGTHVPAAIGHLWSLGTEEQFYLLWPLTLFLALRAGASRRVLAVLLTASIAILFAHRLEIVLRGAGLGRVYFAPDGHFDVLLVGCLAGLWFATDTIPRRFRSPRFLQAMTIAALTVVALMFAFANLHQRGLYLGLLTLFAVAVAALVLAVVVNEGSLLAAFLKLPPLVFVGKISYALYLWHPILLLGVTRLPDTAAVALTFVAATLSYYVVERPFLRWKRRDRAIIDAGPTPRRGRAAEAAPAR